MSIKEKVKPTFSFATIIYDQADTLQMAVESVLTTAQEYETEFVFVDNGSRDRSIDIMRQCEKDWKLNVSYFNLPFGEVPLWEGRLFTFNLCRNDWIILLDGDHIFEDDFFDNIMDKLRELSPITYLVKLKRVEAIINGWPVWGGTQSFHPIVYRNSKDWIEEVRIAKKGVIRTEMGERDCNIPIDLPRSKRNKIIKFEDSCLFNMGSSNKLRALRKWYWWYWQKLDKRHKEISLDSYIKEKTNKGDLNEIAEEHWERWILRRGTRRIWDENIWGALPTPIRNRFGKYWNSDTLEWKDIKRESKNAQL